MNDPLKRASALAQAGRFSEAAQIYREHLARNPQDAEAAHFLGVCLVREGRRAEGLSLVGRSLALAPSSVTYLKNYALLLGEAGEFERAGAQLRKILELDAGDACAASDLGYCLHQRGDLEGAGEWLRRSLALDPRNPMAHNNLGNVLRAQGDPDAAAQCYRRALELAPEFGDAHCNLALALRDLGAAHEAFRSARDAVRCAPGNAAAWQVFADLLAPLRFSAWDAALAAQCEQLFSRAEVEIEHCAEAVLSLVRSGPRGRLLLLLLEHALVADAEFEAQMSALRRELLEARTSLELACALAQQSFLNEYIWPETPAETAALEKLDSKSPMQLALRAMYRPLRGIDKPPGGEAFERLWRRLVEEPRTERELEASIPALVPLQDDVSRKVRAQYEENPYPRWQRAPVVAPYPLRLMLHSLFPHAKRIDTPDSPEILIAGCGTGRHAAITAQLQPRARVLAVDLSRASLAYAVRRCRELRLANVRFAQADILGLGAIPERFDVIECSGVLHHMADPLAGWRVLLSLLRPGGAMKLGLYSQLARRHVAAARDVAAGCDVRAARARILALPEDHPGRQVAALPDFYSASGARDLILHVHEHRFTIPQLAQAVATLGLEFLGFEAGDGTALRAYRLRYPDDPQARSFDNWARFEQEHPDTFAGMYQFWVRR